MDNGIASLAYICGYFFFCNEKITTEIVDKSIAKDKNHYYFFAKSSIADSIVGLKK